MGNPHNQSNFPARFARISRYNLVSLHLCIAVHLINLILSVSMISSLIYSVVVFRRYQKRMNAVVKQYITSETSLMPSQGYWIHD